MIKSCGVGGDVVIVVVVIVIIVSIIVINFIVEYSSDFK